MFQSASVLFLYQSKQSVAFPVCLLRESGVLKNVCYCPFNRLPNSDTSLYECCGVLFLVMLVCGMILRHVRFLGGVAIRYKASTMHADAFCTRINLYSLHVPHDFDLLSDIFKRDTVEVALTAYTYMVCTAELNLLAHTKTIHLLRQGIHFRLLILLKDLPSGRALERKIAIFFKEFKNTTVQCIQSVELFTFKAGAYSARYPFTYSGDIRSLRL